jgi:hypothetical protein
VEVVEVQHYLGAGGGGAGGYRTSTQSVITGTVITVTVGDGGAGGIQSHLLLVQEVQQEVTHQYLV